MQTHDAHDNSDQQQPNTGESVAESDGERTWSKLVPLKELPVRAKAAIRRCWPLKSGMVAMRIEGTWYYSSPQPNEVGGKSIGFRWPIPGLRKGDSDAQIVRAVVEAIAQYEAESDQRAAARLARTAEDLIRDYRSALIAVAGTEFAADGRPTRGARKYSAQLDALATRKMIAEALVMFARDPQEIERRRGLTLKRLAFQSHFGMLDETSREEMRQLGTSPEESRQRMKKWIVPRK